MGGRGVRQFAVFLCYPQTAIGAHMWCVIMVTNDAANGSLQLFNANQKQSILHRGLA
jgi:hypothetical protein